MNHRGHYITLSTVGCRFWETRFIQMHSVVRFCGFPQNRLLRASLSAFPASVAPCRVHLIIAQQRAFAVLEADGYDCTTSAAVPFSFLTNFPSFIRAFRLSCSSPLNPHPAQPASHERFVQRQSRTPFFLLLHERRLAMYMIFSPGRPCFALISITSIPSSKSFLRAS